MNVIDWCASCERCHRQVQFRQYRQQTIFRAEKNVIVSLSSFFIHRQHGAKSRIDYFPTLFDLIASELVFFFFLSVLRWLRRML